MFGLIGAGLQIAQTVTGIAGAAKGAKKDRGDRAEGGGEAKAKKKEDGPNPMDRFREKIRTLTDPKQIDALKDELMDTLYKKMPGDKHKDARQKIVKELEERVQWRKLQLAGKVPAHIHDREQQLNPQPAQAPQAQPPPQAALT